MLTRHKKEPREVQAPGVSQVVALVGSCDPGGFGVSGDGGAAGIGPTLLIQSSTLLCGSDRDHAMDECGEGPISGPVHPTIPVAASLHNPLRPLVTMVTAFGHSACRPQACVRKFS
jgi:hypothetical protein